MGRVPVTGFKYQIWRPFARSFCGLGRGGASSSSFTRLLRLCEARKKSLVVQQTCLACMSIMSYKWAMKTLTLRLDAGLDGWLKAEAERLGRTKSDIVRAAILRQRNGKKN